MSLVPKKHLPCAQHGVACSTGHFLHDYTKLSWAKRLNDRFTHLIRNNY
jgi:hypothetical protein